MAPPFTVFACRPAQRMDRVDVANQIVIGQAKISVTLDDATFQAATFVAIVPGSIEDVNVDSIVQTAYNWIRFIQTERAVVGTTISRLITITERITVAQSIWKSNSECVEWYL